LISGHRRGIRKGKFHLNDPATGYRQVDPDCFDRAFTGIVPLLEPGPGFEPQGVKPRPLVLVNSEAWLV
jgi:ATP-binding cassette subfamily C protein